MRHSIVRLWRRQPLLTLAFVLAVALAAGLATRSVVRVMALGDVPADPPIEGWMTPRFVAHGWHLPPEVMAAALGLEPGAGRGRTLEEIAAARGLTEAELIAGIEAAIADYRAGN